MRNIIFGVIGILWGGMITLRALSDGVGDFSNGYAAAQAMGSIFGVLMLLAGILALITGILQLSTRETPQPPRKPRRDREENDEEDDRPRRRRRRDDD